MDTIRVQKLKGKDKHVLTDAHDDDVANDAHKDHDDAGEDYEFDGHGDNDTKCVGIYAYWQHCHKSVSKNEMIWDVTCQYIDVADLR